MIYLSKATRWFARCATGWWLIVTVVLAGVWVRSHRTPQAWARTQWELSAAVDEWWKSYFYLVNGAATAVFAHQTAPAFVGQVVGAGGAISPDRTTPSGVVWTVLVPGGPLRNDAPAVLSRMGVEWETRRPTASSSTMFPADRWGLRVRLWLPTLLAGAMTVLCGFWSHRAGRPRRRAAAGLCPACGYDLRGSPQRCPECGRSKSAND